MTNEIVLLAGETPWTWALANRLRSRFGSVPIILEDKEPSTLFLRRRLRRLGPLTVTGQVALAVVARAVRPLLRRRELLLVSGKGLDPTPIRSGVERVSSANSDRTIEILHRLRPKVVVLSQTRILSRRLLSQVPATFINLHTGITPKYRGMHGAYWALARGDAENCGVTVHLVDPGIDTGSIIAQARIRPSRSDSYFTYHWAQLAAGLPLLTTAVEDALSGRLVSDPPNAADGSHLFYHPTLWGYVWTGLRRGVW
jgi:methionyl-tRNA formyltransferase